MRLSLIVSTVLTLTLCGCATQSEVAAQQRSLVAGESAQSSAVSTAASGGPAALSPSAVLPVSPSVAAAPSASAVPSLAVSRSPSADLPGTIPWVDLPVEVPVPLPLPTAPLTTTAPPCRASQLQVGDRQAPGDTQDSGTIVRLVNVSSTTCLLAGDVRATLFSDALPPRSIVGRVPTGKLASDDSYDMRPGESTLIWFRATSGCDGGLSTTPPGHAIRVADIAIPGGGHLRVGGLDPAQTCHGPTVSDFWRPHPDPVYGWQPLDGALITVLAPKSVQALSPLHYTVEISNPTKTAITMQPCPSYHQFLSPYLDKRFYRLNCDGHTELLPHQTLRFAMQLEVPPQEMSGRQKLVWSLDTSVGEPQPVIVDIVGSTVTAWAPFTQPSSGR